MKNIRTFKILISALIVVNLFVISNVQAQNDTSDMHFKIGEKERISISIRKIEKDSSEETVQISIGPITKSDSAQKKSTKSVTEEDDIPFIQTKWNNFQIGYNTLLHESQTNYPAQISDLELDNGKSYNFQWHFIRQSMNLYKGKMFLIYGLGLDYNNYRFKKNIDLKKDSDVFGFSNSDISYKKNKLVTQHITVPLMLQFNIGKKTYDKMILGFGVNMGYLMRSHQKQKWEDNGTQKRKVRDDFNLKPFRLGYEVQFGYNRFVLFGRYFPSSIFEDDSVPNLQSVSAGIVLGVFKKGRVWNSKD